VTVTVTTAVLVTVTVALGPQADTGITGATGVDGVGLIASNVLDDFVGLAGTGGGGGI
jgi:hypothetical protein